MKSAKIFLAILLALVMAVSFAIPALAAGASTQVTVQSGSGSQPLVKAMWESTDGNSSSESGDPRSVSE
jgi:hypothetical protein